MIITTAPYRVSFAGGGSDLPVYYRKRKGAVLSTTINKHVYISIHPYFNRKQTLLKYSQNELVDSVDQVRHPIFREALRELWPEGGLEIVSTADVPSGTGLGSSSSFTVALYHALFSYRGTFCSKEKLARKACELEIERLGEPIGKQDQYAAAFGGLRRYRFNPDGSVYVDPVICSEGVKNRLFENLMFFYVGGSRDAREILQEQSDSTERKLEHLQRICDLVDRFHDVLIRGSDVRELGDLLHESWLSKRELAANVSNSRVDQLYEDARNAGAIGGKLLGAGQSGFLMLFCPTSKQGRVREQLRGLREVPMSFEPEGSKIIYVGR